MTSFELPLARPWAFASLPESRGAPRRSSCLVDVGLPLSGPRVWIFTSCTLNMPVTLIEPLLFPTPPSSIVRQIALLPAASSSRAQVGTFRRALRRWPDRATAERSQLSARHSRPPCPSARDAPTQRSATLLQSTPRVAVSVVELSPRELLPAISISWSCAARQRSYPWLYQRYEDRRLAPRRSI